YSYRTGFRRFALAIKSSCYTRVACRPPARTGNFCPKMNCTGTCTTSSFTSSRSKYNHGLRMMPFEEELQVALHVVGLAGQAILEDYARFEVVPDAPADITTETDRRAQEII